MSFISSSPLARSLCFALILHGNLELQDKGPQASKSCAASLTSHSLSILTAILGKSRTTVLCFESPAGHFSDTRTETVILCPRTFLSCGNRPWVGKLLEADSFQTQITYRGAGLLDLVFPIFLEIPASCSFVFSKHLLRGSVLHSRDSRVRRAPSMAITRA